jgi:ABC-type branched-subunit amino acid transport system substrate-binding protein
MINERGGINGRKVNLISLDDGYPPPKTVEQTRRLVESDEVALIFSSIGTAHNTAIAKYLQSKNVPQLFIGSGASKVADGETTGFVVSTICTVHNLFGKIYLCVIVPFHRSGVRSLMRNAVVAKRL